MTNLLPLLIAGIGLFASVSAYGLPAGHQKLDQSADWEAFAYMQDGQQVCALSSQPVAMSPRTKPPREASLIITRRASSAPGQKTRNEIAMNAGQALAPDSQTVLRVADTEFQLFSGASRSGSEAQWAWPDNIDDEPRIIAVMKAGYDMEIHAELENGDKIRDLYSLKGVTRGIGILIENCP